MGGDTRISIFMTGIRNMFSVHTRTMEDTDFHAVRLKKPYYMLAYTVELIFYTVRGYYISMPGFLFGFSCRTIVYIAHMLASLLVMLLWSDHFRRLVRGSVVLMACGYVPCLFLPDGTLRLCFGILGNIGLGGAVTSSRCGFAFACNNVERILGMVVMFFCRFHQVREVSRPGGRFPFQRPSSRPARVAFLLFVGIQGRRFRCQGVFHERRRKEPLLGSCLFHRLFCH